MEKQRRLRTWLVNIVNSGKVQNLEWINKDRKIFRIPWKHESRNDWDPSHAQIFTEWAKFTGKYREGIDKPDYKMFKTRLRCAFNKAPDIEEIVDMRRYKGATPYRVYKLLDYDKKPTPKKSVTYESPVPISTSVSQPPVMVEEMIDTDSLPSLKSQKTMDLLKAVEVEREQQKKLEAQKQVEDMNKINNEVTQTLKKSNITYNPDTHNGSESVARSIQKQMEVNSDAKDDPNSQSLILLQSTRYRCALLKNLFDLQKNGILCDLLLKAKGGAVIPVHANVMCACSVFFKSKVDHWEVGHSGDTEGGCMVIRFDDIAYEVLNGIIQFIYMGEFEVARGSLPIIHNAANTMMLEDLSILCEHVLKALRGTLIDEKNNKPILPKQVPMCTPSEQQKSILRDYSHQNLLTERTDAPALHITVSKASTEIPSLLKQNKVEFQGPSPIVRQSSGSFILPQKPSGKVVTSIPPISELETTMSIEQGRHEVKLRKRNVQENLRTQPGGHRPALLIPKSILNSTDSDQPLSSWHIPQSARKTPEAIPGQNPLDVLCQAVDETIRSESQSEEDDSNLVIDESNVRRSSHDVTEGVAGVPVTKSKGEPVCSIPPIHQTKLPEAGTQAVTSAAPLCIPTSIIQPALVQQQSGLVASPPADPMKSPQGNITYGLTSTPPVRTAPTLVIPRSIIAACTDDDKTDTDSSDQQKQSTPLYRCNFCQKIFAGRKSLEAHMINHRGESAKKQNRKKMDIDSGDVSDEHIQSIIDRIKSQTKEILPPLTKHDNKRSSSSFLPASKRFKKTKVFPREKKVYGEMVLIDNKQQKAQSNGSKDAQIQSSMIIPPINENLKSTEDSEEKYQCEKCQTVFACKMNLDVHYKTCGNVNCSKHACNHCSRIYSSEEGLNKHMKNCASPVVLDHICDQCGKMFAQSSDLTTHMERHEKIKGLTCDVCKKVCKSKLLLKYHVEMHASHKLKYSCIACGKQFLTKKKLELHVQMHVSRMERTKKDSLYECDICKSMFDKKSDLIMHINKHGEDQQDKVEFVQHRESEVKQSSNTNKENVVTEEEQGMSADNQDPKQATIFQVDLADDNTMELPSSTDPNPKDAGNPRDEMHLRCCLICNETFPDHVKKMVHLMSHFQFHTDATKVICQICTSIVDKQDIPLHEKSHSKNKPLECPHCDGAFSNTEELNNHVIEDHQVDSGSTPESPPAREKGTLHEITEAPPLGASLSDLECDRCNAVFNTLEGWKEHMIGHLKSSHTRSSSREPIVCYVCSRVFNGKYASYEYKRHMCSHTGERPIACRYCDKSFKDYSGRSQHEKRVHQRGPLRRGRSKGFRPNRFSSPQPMYQVTRDKVSRPPPLVNLNMLSDEVRQKFFPSLMQNESLENPSDSGPQSSGETSEEEDLSIMVALEGHQSGATGYQKNPGPPPLMYSNPNQSPPSYDSVHTLQAGVNPVTMFNKFHTQGGPPLELLSHLTTSKGNPVLVNTIPLDTISSPSTSKVTETLSQFRPSMMNLQPLTNEKNRTDQSTDELTSSLSLNTTPEISSTRTNQASKFAVQSSLGNVQQQCDPIDLVTTPYGKAVQLPTTKTTSASSIIPTMARVGGQLKVSSVVAPQVRKPPPTLVIPSNIDTQHYPKLIKKRPVKPELLTGIQTHTVEFDNDIDVMKQKAYVQERSPDSAFGSMSADTMA